MLELWPVCLGISTLLWLRLRISSHTPIFTPADNPAAHSPFILTRALSIGRSWAMHGRLLMWPSILSFDWSMGAIPLVSSITDPMNLETLALLVILMALAWVSVTRCWKTRDSNPLTPTHTLYNTYQNQNAYHDMLNNNHILYQFKDSPNNETHGNLWQQKPGHLKLSFHHQVFLALALLVVPFLPASNLAGYVGFVVAERVLYLPSMGTSLLVALGSQVLWHHFSTKGHSLKDYNTNRAKRRANWKQKCILWSWVTLLALHSAKTIKRNQDWHSDETLYRSGVAVNPPKALANLGVVHSEQGRVQEAEEAYRKALRYAPTMADTHYNLGSLLASKGEFEAAIESYEAALRSRPWLAQAYLAMSAALQNLNQQEEAIKVLEKCRNIHSAPARDNWSQESAVTSCRQRLARSYILGGNPHAALEEIAQAIHFAPEGFPAHILYTLAAEAHLEAGEYAEAQDALLRALSKHPHHVPAHLAFSRMLKANGSRVEEAEMWLRRAVALSPDDPHPHKHLAQLLLEQNRFEEAVEAWLKVVLLDPQDFIAAFNAATALRLAGKNHLAETLYRRAVKLQPKDVSSQRNLGAILHLNGKLDEAKKHYEEALLLSPGDPQTTINLSRLKALINKKGIS